MSRALVRKLDKHLRIEGGKQARKLKGAARSPRLDNRLPKAARVRFTEIGPDKMHHGTRTRKWTDAGRSCRWS